MSDAVPQRSSAPRRALTAALLVTLLAGSAACTTSASSKLGPQVAPVRRVWVVASLGSFNALGPAENAARRTGGDVSVAMRKTLPDIFNRNGLPVSGYLELPRPLPNVAALGALWAANRAALPATSHVLVLTAQRLHSAGAGRIEYEAVLWDTASEALVWKATPSYQTSRSRPRAMEADALAGDLLRALQRDELATLPKGYPVDANGVEIPREWVAMRLY